MVSLSDVLHGRCQPRGYVSFRSALVHHGVVLDSLVVIQIASADRSGRIDSVRPGPAEFTLIPRDLYFGWETTVFEGDEVPVATPEKALVDWLHQCEGEGWDPRLEEVEWDVLEPGILVELAERAGIPLLGWIESCAQAQVGSCHDQGRLRLAFLRGATAALRRQTDRRSTF